jgi:predicted transport protein
MWTCPKCGRTFKRKNQEHGCKMVSKESLFAKRLPELKKLYEKIVKEIKKFGEFREEALPSAVIMFKTKSIFLAIRIKKDHLAVGFFLDEVENVPPVSKYIQTSKNRWAHEVLVDRPEDIDKQLINWMKRSYKLITEK